MKREHKKLLKGIALFGGSYYFNDYIGAADGLNKIEKQIALQLNFFPISLASIFASIAIIVIGCAIIYGFVSGLYRICTFRMRLESFEK